MSRWGHAMFRLIICAPERKQAGPECLQDVQYHVVLSYRANVEDMVLSYWKGMDGQYPSQLFILPLPEVLTEYNKLELRDLISLPLGLTPDQKNQFVYRSLEQYWEYQGRYYFLTNNCATESLHFLQGIIPDKSIQRLHDMTPLGLEGDLTKTGLIDQSLLNDRNSAISEGYFFASKRPVLDNAFQQINSRFSGSELGEFGFKDSNDYMAHTSSDQRRGYFDTIMKSTTGNDHMKMAAYFYLLESYISSLDQQKIGAKVSKAVEAGGAPVNEGMIHLLQASQPWGRLRHGGYGVPQASDINQEQVDTQAEQRKAAQDNFQAWMTQEFKSDLDEYQNIELNKAAFRQEIVSPSAVAAPQKS
jgi:hypothetical protein